MERNETALLLTVLVRPEDCPVGPKHVVNRKPEINQKVRRAQKTDKTLHKMNADL
jgi:hypothetical protein